MKVLVFIKENDEWSLENVSLDIEQDKKVLVRFAKQALKERAYTNIQYTSKNEEEYDLSVFAKFVNEVDEDTISFIMNKADCDDYMLCFALDVKELGGN